MSVTGANGVGEAEIFAFPLTPWVLVHKYPWVSASVSFHTVWNRGNHWVLWNIPISGAKGCPRFGKGGLTPIFKLSFSEPRSFHDSMILCTCSFLRMAQVRFHLTSLEGIDFPKTQQHYFHLCHFLWSQAGLIRNVELKKSTSVSPISFCLYD